MWVVTINQPGYLPESEPQRFDTWEMAMAVLIFEVEITGHTEVEGGPKPINLALEALRSWGEGQTGSVLVHGWNHELSVETD